MIDEITIVNLIDSNPGFDDMSRGFSEAISSIYVARGFFISREVLSIKSNKNKIKSSNKIIFIGAGENVFEKLKELKEFYKRKSITIWCGHQDYKDIDNYRDYLDLVVLPKHIVADNPANLDKISRVNIIETFGVPHTFYPDKIKQIYKDNIDKIIKSNNGYIVAIMGGDAPDPDLSGNAQRFYTVEEAKNLGIYLASLSRSTNKKLLIGNGHRTYKYNPSTKELEKYHQENASFDPCSLALISELNNGGLIEGRDYQFDNFVNGKESLYKIYVGAAVSTESIVFIPGESTSMVTQCMDVLKNVNNKQLFVYINNAMNRKHRDYVDILNNTGFIKLLGSDFKDITPTDRAGDNLDYTKSVSELAADRVFSLLNL